MKTRILLKHPNRVKGRTVDALPVEGRAELIVGRDPACDVSYDADTGDLVSRRHLKLVIDSVDPLGVLVIDLGSLNGTFVNKQRVFGAVKLHPGDVVQLGAGGPQFQFDVEPRPGARQEAGPEPSAADTPKVDARIATGIPEPAWRPTAGAAARPGPARRQTRLGRRALRITAVLASLALVAVLTVLGLRNGWWPQVVRVAADLLPGRRLTAEEIARRNFDSIVIVETSWRLIDRATGRQLRQVVVPNRARPDDDRSPPAVAGAGTMLPVFVLAGANQLEPVLTADDGGGAYESVGGSHSASGVVVSSDGSILTTRPGVAPWDGPYSWPPRYKAGLLLVLDHASKVVRRVPVGAHQFPKWIPAKASFVIDSLIGAGPDRLVRLDTAGARTEGQRQSCTLFVPSLGARTPATQVQVSDRSHLAFVRARLPGKVRPALLNRSSRPLDPGFPAVVVSRPPTQRTTVFVSPSRIVRRMPGREADGVYELRASAGRLGSDGDPIFDDRGRLFALSKSGGALPLLLGISVRQAPDTSRLEQRSDNNTQTN